MLCGRAAPLEPSHAHPWAESRCDKSNITSGSRVKHSLASLRLLRTRDIRFLFPISRHWLPPLGTGVTKGRQLRAEEYSCRGIKEGNFVAGGLVALTG